MDPTPLPTYIRDLLELCRYTESGLALYGDASVKGKLVEYTNQLPTILDFGGTDISDVSSLVGVELLQLDNCQNVIDVSSLSTSSTITHLSLSNTQISDISTLGSGTIPLTSLDLSYCESVTDVSPLAGKSIVDLNLRGCKGITDVSALGNIPTLARLDLRNCDKITDVSMLGGVAFLRLEGCTGITDFSAVPNALR